VEWAETFQDTVPCKGARAERGGRQGPQEGSLAKPSNGYPNAGQVGRAGQASLRGGRCARLSLPDVHMSSDLGQRGLARGTAWEKERERGGGEKEKEGEKSRGLEEEEEEAEEEEKKRRERRAPGK